MTLSQFNNLPPALQAAELSKCCGSTAWVKNMITKIPFSSIEDVHAAAETVWFSLHETDWKDAFDHHPKIGDLNSLQERFRTTAAWATGEQARVHEASEKTLQELKSLNEEYEKKFGFIFIVFASGKSAGDMLSLLKARLKNNPAFEMTAAVQEQNKITHLRIDKLFA